MDYHLIENRHHWQQLYSVHLLVLTMSLTHITYLFVGFSISRTKRYFCCFVFWLDVFTSTSLWKNYDRVDQHPDEADLATA